MVLTTERRPKIQVKSARFVVISNSKRRRRMRKHISRLAIFALVLMFVLSACGGTPTPTEAAATDAPSATEAPATEAPAPEPFVFGLLMVGPYNDNGWSQAHYEAGLYIEEHMN